MHRFARALALCFCALGFVHVAVSAAVLSGRVRDANTNAFLVGSTLTLAELNRSTRSTAGGDFSFGNIPAGTYTLVASYLGYDDVRQTVTVSDSAEARVDLSLGGEVVKMADFVVEGSREGQARALQQKRSADSIMDAVSADAVGKFPDGNAAEALRRVPGVSLEIDQGEGRFVVVRGIDAALNNVTLNGQSVGSPAEQGRRGLAMDSVPADLIARLEVVKAVTPDLDGNAIGGSINIVTQSPFDRDEPSFFLGSVSKGYNDFSARWGWQGASATYGRVLDANKRWGVIGGVSYSFKEFASQTSDQLNWTPVNGNYVSDTQESFDYHVERERLGANVALEFRPSDGNHLYLRLNHNEFTDEEGRQKTGYNFRLGTLTNQTATSGTNSQGRATKEFRDYRQIGTIQAASLGGKHELGADYVFEWQAGLSHGERRTPRRVDWEFRSAANAFPNTYNLAGDIPIITPNAAFYDPASYPFRRVRFRRDDEQEDVTTLQADLKRDLNFGSKPAYVKVGAKWLSSEKTQDRTNTNYNLTTGAANLFTLAATGLAGAEPANFMDGRYRFGPTINLANLQEYFRANPGRFTFDATTTLNDSTNADFDGTEDVIAGYAMANVQTTPKSNLLGGVRVERTESKFSAFEVRNGVRSRVSLENSYTEVLPGLHYNIRPTDRLVLRAAWTNTYGRTNYTDLAPRNVLDDTDLGGGVFQGSLSGGNPGLKPYESMNFDVSAEYYLKNAGILSAGVFHKIIDNPVYRKAYTLNNTTYNGRNYQTLNITRPENADSGRITGLELNYQQFFSMLPAPFDGLGVNFNYTITDSSATLPGRAQKVKFFKQSDSVGNIALVYEKYGFEARVAYAFNSEYLDSVGAAADQDGFIDERKVIDAKVSYRIHPRARIFAEFLNINEEPLREFQGVESRRSSIEIYSWNMNVGVSFNF